MEPRVKSTHPLHTSFDLVPLALKKTADLVDLLQAKALSQPEALARGRPSLAYASGYHRVARARSIVNQWARRGEKLLGYPRGSLP